MTTTVPIRLLVHFQVTTRPLVQVTEGIDDGSGHVRGAGTRAIDTSNDAENFPVINPTTGLPTGETASVAHALAILYSLSKKATP